MKKVQMNYCILEKKKKDKKKKKKKKKKTKKKGGEIILQKKKKTYFKTLGISTKKECDRKKKTLNFFC